MYGATESGHHHFCLSYDPSTLHRRPYRLKSFFLSNVSSEAAERFCSIILDHNMTKAEMRNAITKWAQQQGTAIAKSYARWQQKRDQTRQAIALKRRILAQSLLSEEAKDVNERIETILRDQNITSEEETLLVAELFNNASSEVRAQLYELNDAVASRNDVQYRIRERFLEHMRRFRAGIAEHFARMNRFMGSLFGKNCEECKREMHNHHRHMAGCHHCTHDEELPARNDYRIDPRRVHYWP